MAEDKQGISVTLKYPKPKYQDAPWIVFHNVDAEQVRADLITAFGWDVESVTDLTLHEVVMKAQEAIQAGGNVANELGGKVLSSGSGAKSSAWSQAGSRASEQAEGEDKPAEDPTAWLKVEIEKSTTVAGLQRLWADNKAAFAEDAALMDLYKAKGKSLST